MHLIRAPLEWMDAVVEKVETKHGLTVEEVEESIFEDDPLQPRRGREETALLLGRSFSGRYVLTVLAWNEASAMYRVVTAREMTSTERSLYRR